MRNNFIKVLFNFTFLIIISISHCSAETNFGVVQDFGHLLNDKTIKIIDECTLPIQSEYKNFSFHFLLITESVTDNFDVIQQEIANNYKDANTSTRSVFLIYKLSDHTYKFIIDPDLTNKISPVLLVYFMEGNNADEIGFKTRMQSKKYDEGVLEYIPRMMAYFALSQNYKTNQQEAMAGAKTVNPACFEYKKITDVPVNNVSVPQQETKKNNSSLWFVVILLIITTLFAGFFGYKIYKKRQEEKEFDAINLSTDEYESNLEEDGEEGEEYYDNEQQK